MHRRQALLAAALLLALLAPSASACGGVPCGYVYPRLLFDLGERGQAYMLTAAQPLRLEGTLTFTWDMTAEGLAAPNPSAPIVVTFDFPRKPGWLAIAIEPERLEIPISPQFVAPEQTAAGTALVYRYTAPIAVTATLTGTPVVDPELPPSLLLLAQSSESGLYKPGFGVRDVALDLPEALVRTAAPGEARAVRVGAPEPLALELPALEFEGATLTLEAAEPVHLWKPASLVARVLRGGAPAKAIDLAASVVDERNDILYTTGLRSRADGALPFSFTFPAPGAYRVHVAARPVPGASDLSFDPLAATFDVVLPGLEFDALRYPDAYRASYLEPTTEFHANAQDLPRQFEKSLRFPALAGADSVSVQVALGSSAGAALGGGSVYAEVLSPSDEQLAFGKLDALTPTMDARLRGPLPAGDYRLHLYGTGANPLALGGTELAVDIGVFYPEEPVASVDARGAPRPLAGGAIPLGTGGMELDLVLHEAPALWAPMHATLVAKDAQGRVALHPDFILTVRSPEGQVLYTTGHRHPHDGLLHWSFAPPSPGLYLVSAFAGPTPELSANFWQPAIASWPLRLDAPADARLPATYRAEYTDSTSTVRTDGYGDGSSFDKRYPVPVLEGARTLTANLDLTTMAMVQHMDGVAPASLALELLGPDGAALARSAPATGAGGASLEVADLEPGAYAVRVVGAGYAPLDYSGAMYELAIEVAYDAPPTATFGAAAPPATPPPRAVPGFEVVLLVGALVMVIAGRRR